MPTFTCRFKAVTQQGKIITKVFNDIEARDHMAAVDAIVKRVNGYDTLYFPRFMFGPTRFKPTPQTRQAINEARNAEKETADE